MNYVRSHLTAVVFHHEIYAIGGIYNKKTSCLVEKFNPLTNKWYILPKLNVERNRPGVCVINNRIAVVGGESGVIEAYGEEDANTSQKIVGE